MRHELKQRLYDYLNRPDHLRTREEDDLLDMMKSEIQYFDISTVTREDVTETGFHGEDVSDEDMELLARSMGETYEETDYRQVLADHAENYINITKL